MISTFIPHNTQQSSKKFFRTEIFPLEKFSLIDIFPHKNVPSPRFSHRRTKISKEQKWYDYEYIWSLISIQFKEIHFCSFYEKLVSYSIWNIQQKFLQNWKINPNTFNILRRFFISTKLLLLIFLMFGKIIFKCIHLTVGTKQLSVRNLPYHTFIIWQKVQRKSFQMHQFGWWNEAAEC